LFNDRITIESRSLNQSIKVAMTHGEADSRRRYLSPHTHTDIGVPI
jgi:hypothetical protein